MFCSVVHFLHFMCVISMYIIRGSCNCIRELAHSLARLLPCCPVTRTFVHVTACTCFITKLENVAITAVLPHAASRCAQTRSSTVELESLHYLKLNGFHSHSPALACAHQNSTALAHPPVGSHSLTFSRRLELFRTQSPSAAFSFHSLPSCYSSNK